MTTQDTRQYPAAVRLPRDLYEEMRRMAQEEERTVAQMVRVAVGRYVRQQKQAEEGGA